MTIERRDVRIPVPALELEVDGLLWRPRDASSLLVLAHGAGAGMDHRGMEALATTLAAHRVATLRYQFPYRQKGGRRPDPPRRLVATVRAAVEAARSLEAGSLETGLPLLAGGRSMGGRMTSTAQAAEPLPDVVGLVLFAFPLHPAGKPGTSRAAHLRDVEVPMLFLQGTRDRLADRELLEPVLGELPAAEVRWLDGADHGFAVLKRSGRTDDEVLDEIGSETARWIVAR